MDQVQNEIKPDTNLVQEKVDKNLTQQSSENVSQTSLEETPAEINWKKFKEARALERKQAEEMSKRAVEKEAEALALKAALEAALSKPNQNQYQQQYSQQNNNDYQEEETEDQRIEKKVALLLSKKEAEAEKKRQEKEQVELPNKLKRTYSDFDQICSSGNLDYLEYHHPELAKSLQRQPDSFEKWNDIYQAVKRYIPNTDARKDQAKAESNFKKPQSASATGMAPSGNNVAPHILTEERRAANWKRMQQSLGRIG